MSAEAMTWAFKVDVVIDSEDPELVERLKIAPKFALVTLANYADEAHSSFPSFNTLADRMSCSRSTAIAAVKTLEKYGLVIIEKRRRGNQSHTSSRYHLPVENWAPKVANPGADSALGVPDRPVDNSERGGADSTPAQSRIRTPLNRQPNHRLSSGPVPEVSPETAVDNSTARTGPFNHPTPRALSTTHGKPLQPADVFAAVGRSLPDTFDDRMLEQLAEEILARSASRVLDPTGYVIRALRDHDLASRGSWLIRAEDIARDAAFATLTDHLENEF